MENIFLEIGILVIIATCGAYAARLLKQPLIPAYIIAGAIIGPVLHLITSSELISTLSEIGIAFLLFIVGLELDFNRLRNIGLISSIGGTLQTAVLFAFAFVIAIALGFKTLTAAYLGIVMAFSSTMVIVKLLADKKELDTLHGRIIIGILLMQDIIAIFALSVLAASTDYTLINAVTSFLGGAIVIAIAYVANRHIFPVVFKKAAESQELLLMISLTVCFLFAILFHLIGLSIIVGAFIAGVALANLPYNIEIVGRVKPLRDFFATLFFASLGMQLVLVAPTHILIPLVVFTLFTVLLKPIVTMSTCAFFGYTKKTSYLAAMTSGQISEFALIIVAQGLLLGHISQEIFSITTILAIITISVTSYMMKFDTHIYEKIKKYLGMFNFRTPSKLEYLPNEHIHYDVILCGYDRIGFSIMRSIKHLAKTFLVIDFNPDIIKKLIRGKIPCLYGDVSDPEILERIDFRKVRFIISTVTGFEGNMFLLKKSKADNSNVHVFVTASSIENALKFYKHGADYVIMPHFLGGERVSHILTDVSHDVSKITHHRDHHMKELIKRKELGHSHPKSEVYGV